MFRSLAGIGSRGSDLISLCPSLRLVCSYGRIESVECENAAVRIKTERIREQRLHSNLNANISICIRSKYSYARCA